MMIAEQAISVRTCLACTRRVAASALLLLRGGLDRRVEFAAPLHCACRRPIHAERASRGHHACEEIPRPAAGIAR